MAFLGHPGSGQGPPAAPVSSAQHGQPRQEAIVHLGPAATLEPDGREKVRAVISP